jgi:adenylate cyclase
MQHKSDTLAILFADISGSTRLYETLGNARARQMVAQCLGLMSSRLAPHRGTLVKTIGDEIMCTFPRAEDALRAACDMQDAVENGRPGGDTPMYVRIGFNFGEVLHEAGDVHGDAVNVAARVTAVARARQILATHAAVNALPAELRDKTRHIERASIKGRQNPLDLFHVTWRPAGGDSPRVGTPAYRKPEDYEERLFLRHGEQQFTLSEQHNMGAILGRGAGCQVAVQDDDVSDQHARVECHLGKFIVCDRSASGTYVRFMDGDTVHLVRQDLVLHGSGVMSLGRPFSDEQVRIIEFAIRLAPA